MLKSIFIAVGLFFAFILSAFLTPKIFDFVVDSASNIVFNHPFISAFSVIPLFGVLYILSRRQGKLALIWVGIFIAGIALCLLIGAMAAC